MAFELCPRCKLNYVKPGMKYCKICMNEFKDIEDDGEVCPVCGENVLDDGEDICSSCLEHRMEMSGYSIEEESPEEEADSDSDEFDGMRLVDIDDDAPEDVKEDFDTESE